MKLRLHLSLAALCFAAGLASAQSDSFEVSSPTFSPLSTLHVLKGFDCEGGNQSPELHWANAPEGTKSFAVTLYDPDAPTGSGWWHWVVYDIPASETGLAADAGNADGSHLPGKAVQGRTDFGTPGFGGACPPVGDAPHRYVLTVHAQRRYLARACRCHGRDGRLPDPREQPWFRRAGDDVRTVKCRAL